MLAYQTITCCAKFYKKNSPHLSFQRLIRMVKVDAVPFYHFHNLAANHVVLNANLNKFMINKQTRDQNFVDDMLTN